ncbi:Adenine phosphoribosyltransferase [invertebrate metagenome]|uniref:adenine phosphoribosyltransferase n=1 Tax=invertebrate metagenome TaxID=1711999 RepID=A0A2H9TAH5_9ZZZZ
MSTDESFLKSCIGNVEDWPKTGIVFRDIATLFANPKAVRIMIDSFLQRYREQDISHIAALDARGFLIGSIMAYEMDKPLIMLRKKGKLPGTVISHEYALEYGTDVMEMQVSALASGDRVLLMDDLIATGGTLLAGCELIRQVGAEVVEAAAIIDLVDLEGTGQLRSIGVNTFALCHYGNEE